MGFWSDEMHYAICLNKASLKKKLSYVISSGAAKTKEILKTAEGFLFFYFIKSNLDRKKSTAAKAGVAAMLPPALLFYWKWKIQILISFSFSFILLESWRIYHIDPIVKTNQKLLKSNKWILYRDCLYMSRSLTLNREEA